MMIGAYATYLTQQGFVKFLPAGAFDWYFIAAIPVAFVTAGLVGMLIETTIIRHLYGRPLDTLLATLGVSYILVQIIEPRDVGPIGSTIIFSQGMATVKVVGRAESYETLAPIAKAMHEAIQGSQHVDVSGGGVLLSARRRSALSYPEESNGIEYRHLGGAYEVTAQ